MYLCLRGLCELARMVCANMRVRACVHSVIHTLWNLINLEADNSETSAPKHFMGMDFLNADVTH